MKVFLEFSLAVVIVAIATMETGADVFGNNSGHSVFQDPSNPNSTWSGSKEDLDAIIAQAKANYGFEDAKHLGRNATMPVPATLKEMEKEVEQFGNSKNWDTSFWDGAHGNGADSDDWDITWAVKSMGNGVVKYVNSQGDEVVYDKGTGKIRTDEKMGTHNFDTENSFWSATFGEHNKKDMAPNKTKANSNNSFERDGDQYKYVGILYERDPNNPNKFYLVDGQTGKRLTKRQAEEFPTTLSDMWKDQGLTCVANDAKDYEQTPKQPSAPARAQSPTENVDSSISSGPAQVSQTPSSIENTISATQPYTIDNTAMKQYMSQQLESAYSTASAMAAEAGVGAEYQSAVAPAVNYGRSAISSIPDKQTITVPAGTPTR